MGFMQDNARTRTTWHTQEALRRKKNQFDVTPYQIPYLNPIEHFWDFLKQEIHGANNRPQNEAQLHHAI